MDRIVQGNVQVSDKVLKLFRAITKLEQQCRCLKTSGVAVPCPACHKRWNACYKLGRELKLGPYEWPYLIGPKDRVDPSNPWQREAQARYRDFQNALGQ
jgi:hypothetical protein